MSRCRRPLIESKRPVLKPALRLVLATLAVSTFGLVAAFASTGAALAHSVERVSVSSDGAQGNDTSLNPSISADGRWVAYESSATNLALGDTNNARDIFVHDRQTGITERVSVAGDGKQADGWSSNPSVSADGRYVAFMSTATNLVPGDTNNLPDIFVHDRQTGTTERVDVSGDGIQANGAGYLSFPTSAATSSAISADGRYVIFSSDATNLVPEDTNGYTDVFLRDRVAGTTERVSVGTGGIQADAASLSGVMSPDGRYVAFTSSADNLVAGDAKGGGFVRDRQTGITEPCPGGASAISADGRYVAFGSSVYDRQTGTTTLVGVSSTGVEGNGLSGNPSISADGRYVAFISSATNLVPGDTNSFTDLFIRDLQKGVTQRASVSAKGVQANADADPAAMSADGRVLAFATMANELVPGGTFGFDVYVVEATPSDLFPDISFCPYKTAIEGLAEAHVIAGYDDGRFGPDDPVLRAQFAKMIVLSLGLPVSEGALPVPFPDVEKPADDLYPDDYVAVAAANGLVKGYLDGSFRPYIDITRAQVLTMVVRAAKALKPSAVQQPPAGWKGVLPASDPTHGANIAAAEYSGLLSGIELSIFSVWDKATRGEIAQILWNLTRK